MIARASGWIGLGRVLNWHWYAHRT